MAEHQAAAFLNADTADIGSGVTVEDMNLGFRGINTAQEAAGVTAGENGTRCIAVGNVDNGDLGSVALRRNRTDQAAGVCLVTGLAVRHGHRTGSIALAHVYGTADGVVDATNEAAAPVAVTLNITGRVALLHGGSAAKAADETADTRITSSSLRNVSAGMASCHGTRAHVPDEAAAMIAVHSHITGTRAVLNGTCTHAANQAAALLTRFHAADNGAVLHKAVPHIGNQATCTFSGDNIGGIVHLGTGDGDILGKEVVGIVRRTGNTHQNCGIVAVAVDFGILNGEILYAAAQDTEQGAAGLEVAELMVVSVQDDLALSGNNLCVIIGREVDGNPGFLVGEDHILEVQVGLELEVSGGFVLQHGVNLQEAFHVLDGEGLGLAAVAFFLGGDHLEEDIGRLVVGSLKVGSALDGVHGDGQHIHLVGITSCAFQTQLESRRLSAVTRQDHRSARERVGIGRKHLVIRGVLGVIRSHKARFGGHRNGVCLGRRRIGHHIQIQVDGLVLRDFVYILGILHHNTQVGLGGIVAGIIAGLVTGEHKQSCAQDRD